MHSTPSSHTPRSSGIPAPRYLQPGDTDYPLADVRWQGWAGVPELFGAYRSPPVITAVGSAAVLHRPRLGVICSMHCPGDIALETYRIARTALPGGPVVIGGFHSPMERTVFDLLTARHVPVVVCPGRRILSRSVPAFWGPAIAEGRLLILSPFPSTGRRVDRAKAGVRNAFIAALAETIFVPYARPGGAAAALVMTLLEAGKSVVTLEARDNEALVVLGARAMRTEDLITMVRGGETQDPGLPGRDPLVLQ